MRRVSVVKFRAVFVLPLALLVSSCAGGPSYVAKKEKAPWRNASEQACLASGRVQQTAFLTPVARLGGPGACGAIKPFKMSAADYGRVSLRPAAILRCPMVSSVDDWIKNSIAPAAARHLGTSVKQLTVAASYGCRPRNGIAGAKLSEHGLANALDVSAFLLADGRKITVKRGWKGTADERAFLRAVRAGACERFSTVLSPDADRFHHDHFHVDLARHNRAGTYRVCR